MIRSVNTFKSGWYILYTRPRHEKKVAQCLSGFSRPYFLPTIKKLSVRCDRRKFIETPLFPSYIFVQLNSISEYYDCLHLDGCLYFVRFGKEVVRVSEAVIHNIRLIVDTGNEVEVSSNYFQVGQQLVIQHGPLTGLQCEVVKHNNNDRMLVRVHLLQRNLLVAMPSENLLSISA